MSSYSILGSGRNAKLLRLTGAGNAETVTTAPVETLHAILGPLTMAGQGTLGALYQFARALAGQPAHLRRDLLALFDATLEDRDLPALPTDHGVARVATWAARLATTCRDLPGPVTAAIRGEVARHLVGLDGVLVPGTISEPTGYRPESVDLVLSPVLADLADDFWRELFANEPDGFTKLGLGSSSDDLAYDVLDQYGAHTTISEVLAAVRSHHDSGCDIEADPSLVLAWLTAHRPHLLGDWPGIATTAR